MIEDTKTKILKAGKKEFLAKGYMNASLRTIAKVAGVTTGAVYGYFPDKSSLFAALVKEPADRLLEWYIGKHEEFKLLSPEDQATQGLDIADTSPVTQAIDFIYDNFDAFKLIVSCSEGTEYSGFIDKMVEVEMEVTAYFMENLKKMGYSVKPLDDDLLHLLCNAFLFGMFEVVAHEMDKDKALSYVRTLQLFYTAGWKEIMGYEERDELGGRS